MYQWDENNPKGYFNRMGYYKTTIELDFIKQFIKTKHSILDMGGGSGRFAIPLTKAGFDVTVIDSDKSAIELCIKKGINKAYCENVLNYNGNIFDAAIAIELFLVSKPEEIVQQAQKILNPDGVFIFTCNNKNSWRFKLRKLRNNKSANFDNFSYKEYVALINKNNFVIINTKGFMWMPFKVNSNNILIALFAKIEKSLFLDKWLNQSPWLIFACSKKNENIN